MATYTSNLNLKKPGLSDDALIADINGNMDLLDTDAGKLRADIAIVENGNTATHNIAEGQYVVWKGDLYIASAAIASGATLSSSNLTAKPNGLGGEVTSLSDQIGTHGFSENIATEVTADGSVTKDLSVYRYIIVAYFTGLHYRQTAIYPAKIFTGSTKCGLDNLDSSSRCYFLKQSYNATTHEITYACVIPNSGNWANGRFDVWGIK